MHISNECLIAFAIAVGCLLTFIRYMIQHVAWTRRNGRPEVHGCGAPDHLPAEHLEKFQKRPRFPVIAVTCGLISGSVALFLFTNSLFQNFDKDGSRWVVEKLNELNKLPDERTNSATR